MEQSLSAQLGTAAPRAIRAPGARNGRLEPDTFVQMPPTQTNEIARLRYMTDPLPEDMLVIGPLALNLYAAIDQEDTNWIVVLKDVGSDVSVHTARPGEVDLPAEHFPEREAHSRLAESFAPRDRSGALEAVAAVASAHARRAEAGRARQDRGIQDRILSTGNLFKAGHRICLDITSLDLPSGLAGACSSKTVVHKIYNEQHPSHLVLPIISALGVRLRILFEHDLHSENRFLCFGMML